MVECESASNFPPLLPFHGDQQYFGSPLVLNWGPYLVPKPFSVLTISRYSYLYDRSVVVCVPHRPSPLGEGLIGPLINSKHQPSVDLVERGEGALVLQQGRVRPKIASNCHLLSLAGCTLARHFPSTIVSIIVFVATNVKP